MTAVVAGERIVRRAHLRMRAVNALTIAVAATVICVYLTFLIAGAAWVIEEIIR